MTKHPWKHIGNHIDPEKEEELKWAKTEIESQVKRVVKLTKSMNHGNKEKNKSEAINIVEDFQKQYELLYSLYEDLREQVKKIVKASCEGDTNSDNSNSSPDTNSDSESFYSLGSSNSGRAPLRSNSFSEGSDSSEPDQTSDLDDTILKDKLTCSSQVKEITDLETEKNQLSDLDNEKENHFSPCKFLAEKISISSFHDVEKKVEEMVEEYGKQLDDKYRILSRRIRAAEQLQAEHKEWYRKTKEAFEERNQDLKNGAERNETDLQNIRDVAVAVNHALTLLDSVALNFEECSDNFLNRISKASCELKFAKHWAMRKNKAVLHVKDDLDCLLAQVEGFREKVRELEKMVKEKEDGMLGLMEEKREAIRQLCIWVDYHRGRSDHYMKILSEMNLVRFARGRLS